MVRLSDTSFVVFANYEFDVHGGPLYALNAKAYGLSGKLLWCRTFGLNGYRSFLGNPSPVAGGGFDIIVNEPDTILPSRRHTNYYRFDPAGNVVDGPFDVSGWPGTVTSSAAYLRPNRLGFLAYDYAVVAGRRSILVYRADARLQNGRIDTIAYGADSLHTNLRVYPTGDDGFLYYAIGPDPGFGLDDTHNYFYLARYDAAGNFLWGGRRKHMRLDFDMLADGGMLVLARQDTGFRSGIARGQILTFTRINADSSVQWSRPFFAVSDTGITGKIAFDGRDGGVFYGEKGINNLGAWPWVGYITNLGRPLDPTPVQRPMFTGSPGGLQVYPNPARSGSRLRYRLPAGSRAGAFTLLAPDGRSVAEFPLTSPEGELTLPPGLASGLYLLRGPAHTCRVAVE